MIGNTNHYPETEIGKIDTIKNLSPFPLLDALRVRYNTQAEVVARLTDIENNLKKVSPSVQLAVAEILKKLNLASNMANTGLMTAAIMAINPANLVGTLSANDDMFQSAA